MDWITGRSQQIINAVRATIVLLIGFHVVEVTQEQLLLVIAALESVFAVITAKTTVSHTNVDAIVEKRVALATGTGDGRTDA